MNRKRNRIEKNRTGAYTVEMALCLPVLLVLIFACFEFSRFVFVRHSIKQAAYQGARQAISLTGSADSARASIARSLRGTGLEAADIQISPAVISEDTREVTVTLSLNFEDVWIQPVFFRGRVLTGEVTLDHENAALVVDN